MHDSLVYIAPVNILFRSNYGCSIYWDCKEHADDDMFSSFVEQDDDFDVSELGMTESEYVHQCLETVLCSMAHDDCECPDYDYEDDWEPDVETEYWPSNDFAIAGGTGREDDIVKFKDRIEQGLELSVSLKGRPYAFMVYVEPYPDAEQEEAVCGPVYTLCRIVDDEYIDPDNKDTVPSRSYERVLRSLDWFTLYAKALRYIYNIL